MLLAILAIAESRRVQQYVRFIPDPDPNSDASASRAGGASANSSGRDLELKSTLADPSAQELARCFTQQMDTLLAHMVGSPKLQEEIRALTGEVRAMMADPLLQQQATLVSKQLDRMMKDADFQEQVEQVVTQMQAMMTDPQLQDEAERLAKQMEKGTRADEKLWDHSKTLAQRAEAMEAITHNPRLHEHARRLFKQLEAIEANHNFQDQAMSIAQLMETLMADPNFQRPARRIAAHVEAIVELTQEELARFLTKQMDILLTEMVGDPKLQEEIRTLIGELGAMISDPLLQHQATLVAEQLEKAMADANFQEQAEQLLEQAVELVTQMQTMMTDPRLQGEAERFAKQMEEGMSADGKPWDNAMEVIMADPVLHEHARRLFKQWEAMKVNQNFQDQITPIAQLMETLLADPSFQRHTRRIAAHVEAIRAHLNSQTTDGGHTLDSFSLAEVNRSSSGVSFLPPVSAWKHRTSVQPLTAAEGIRSMEPSLVNAPPRWAEDAATLHPASLRVRSVTAPAARTPPLQMSALSVVTPGEPAKENRAKLVAGDLVSAVLAALIVTPLTMIVDVAVTKAASGDMTVPAALVAGVLEWVTSPVAILKTAAFKLCLFVYVCTYAGANLADAISTLYLRISPVLPKLVTATLANMFSCMYKDARLAQILGKSADPRPFPMAGYVLFLLRDILANGGGFTFPPMVAPRLESRLGKRAKTVSQLLVPAAINLVTAPLHLLALSLYNSPSKTPMGHLAAIAATYVGVTSLRILKGFAAYGLGGVSNTALRAKLGSGARDSG